MPELPEVESARMLVERHCLNLTVQDAIVADDDSEALIPYLFDNTPLKPH